MELIFKIETMRHFISILFFLYCLNIFTQNNNYYGKITYEQVTNFGFEFIEKYELVFTKNWSYSEEINIQEKENYQTISNDDNGISNINVVGRKNKTPKYFYNTKSEFYFRDNFSDQIFTVQEKPDFPKWKLINDTKKIGEFQCKKASVFFRGRTYFAWYAPNIPLPFGPWKARGLPGIILEFYEENYVFHITTKKIIINNKLPLKLILPTKEIENAINIESYLMKKEKIKDLFLKKLSSKQPKGSKPIKRDKNCEDCNNSILEIFE